VKFYHWSQQTCINTANQEQQVGKNSKWQDTRCQDAQVGKYAQVVKTQVGIKQVLSAGSDVPEGTNLNLQPTTSPLFHFHALVGVLHVLDYSEYNCFTKTILILRFYYHLWDP
jgi:hypothetical protein